MIALWTTALAAQLTADAAVGHALDQATVVAAEARSDAATWRAWAAGWPDAPTLEAEWAAVGEAQSLSVAQPLSLTGQGLAERQEGAARAARSEAELTRTRLEVAAATRSSWARTVEAQQDVLLSEQALELAVTLRAGAEARLASGDGSQLDARLARLHEAEARSSWMAAVEAEGQRLAELAAWTGLAPEELELPDDPLAGMSASPSGTGERSDLQAAELGVAAAEAQLRAARRATLPPLELGAFYEDEDGEVRAGPTVSVTLPVWRAGAEDRAEALAAYTTARAQAEAAEQAASAEQATTSSVLDRLEAGSPEADPRAEARAAWESVSIGYERGELDLLTAGLLREQILDGQRAWLAGRRVLAEARIAAALAHEDPALLGPG